MIRAITERGFSGTLAQTGRDLGRFAILVLRKARRDNITLIASALAFITILSFIPLLAALSFVGERFFGRFEERTLEVLSAALPYSEEAVLRIVGESLAAARALSGFGWLALFLTALLAFSTVERTLNRIWRVPRQRSLRARFLSFTLLLFWGPILIGLSFSGRALVNTVMGRFDGPALGGALTFVLTGLGLAMLYALVPNTPVRLSAAWTGSLVATILLTLLRAGFGHYVALFKNVNVIYGGFAVSLFFMLSVSFAWAIALLGSVVAYTLQHFKALSRREQGHLPLEGRWAGLAWLVFLTEDLRKGMPVVAVQSLADRLQVPPEALSRVAGTLLKQGWITTVPGTGATSTLAVDPHELTVAEVFSVYDRLCTQLLEPGDEPRGRIGSLVLDLADRHRDRLDGLSIADLAEPPADQSS